MTDYAKSNYLENEILDQIIGASAWTAPVTLYFALFTVAPTDAGGGTEVTGGSYAREAKTNNLTNFPAAVDGEKTNANDIDFGTATADWGTIVAVAVFDADTAGNMLYYGTLDQSKPVSNTDSFKLPAGDVTFKED